MKFNSRRLLRVASILALLPCGCANPYAKFYADGLDGRTASQLSELIPSDGEPKLYSGDDIEEDNVRMLEEGFALIGYSCFSAANVDSSGATQQAQDVGAQVVLVYSKFSHTVNGVSTITTPTPPQTSTTYASGSAWGTGGNATYSGTATTTTTTSGGYTTQLVPYSIDRYEYVATYWVRRRSPAFGAQFRDLSANEKQSLERNRGAVVVAVVKRSPAFEADILRGDVIVRIDSTVISDAGTIRPILEKCQGTNVVVEILRNGRSLFKNVRVGDKSSPSSATNP